MRKKRKNTHVCQFFLSTQLRSPEFSWPQTLCWILPNWQTFVLWWRRKKGRLDDCGYWFLVVDAGIWAWEWSGNLSIWLNFTSGLLVQRSSSFWYFLFFFLLSALLFRVVLRDAGKTYWVELMLQLTPHTTRNKMCFVSGIKITDWFRRFDLLFFFSFVL